MNFEETINNRNARGQDNYFDKVQSGNEQLQRSCEEHGMEVNVKKTKGLVIGTNGTTETIKIGREILFKYLRSIFK